MESMKNFYNLKIKKIMFYMPNCKDFENAHNGIFNAYLNIQSKYAMHYFKHIMDNIDFYNDNFNNLISENTQLIIMNYKEPCEEYKSFYEQFIYHSYVHNFLWLIKNT